MAEPFVVSDDDQGALDELNELVATDPDGVEERERLAPEAPILAENVGRQAAGGAGFAGGVGGAAGAGLAAAGTAATTASAVGQDPYAPPVPGQQTYAAPLHPLPIHGTPLYQQPVAGYQQPGVAYQPGFGGGYPAAAPRYGEPAIPHIVESGTEGYAPPPANYPIHPGPYDTPAAVTQYPANYRSSYSPHQGHYPTRAPYDSFSIAALVAGIAGITLLPGLGSILAVVLGIVGLNHARERGAEGRGFAIAGLVLGGLSLLFWGLVFLLGFLHYSPMTGFEF